NADEQDGDVLEHHHDPGAGGREDPVHVADRCAVREPDLEPGADDAPAAGGAVELGGGRAGLQVEVSGRRQGGSVIATFQPIAALAAVAIEDTLAPFRQGGDARPAAPPDLPPPLP